MGDVALDRKAGETKISENGGKGLAQLLGPMS